MVAPVAGHNHISTLNGTVDYIIALEYTFSEIEFQLRHRLAYPYKWGRRQNDVWDAYTQYIYTTFEWEALVAKMKHTCEQYPLDKSALFQYASNRWYNFWHSVAVENMFATLEGVRKVTNHRDREKDFFLHGIPFDHKTTVFPKKFAGNLDVLRQHPNQLLYWLYEKQSLEQRHHKENRLFIVVYKSTGEHWKLKCELSLIKKHIENYAANFTRSQVQTLTFANGASALSDIIWVIQ